MPKPGSQVLLKASYDCVVGPPGLGEKALHRPGGDAHRFGEILGVAPLLGLHQQGPKIVPAVLPPLLADEGCRKETMKSLEAVVDPLEARRIHHPYRPPSSAQLSHQTTRRCSTSGSFTVSCHGPGSGRATSWFSWGIDARLSALMLPVAGPCRMAL